MPPGHQNIGSRSLGCCGFQGGTRHGLNLADASHGCLIGSGSGEFGSRVSGFGLFARLPACRDRLYTAPSMHWEFYCLSIMANIAFLQICTCLFCGIRLKNPAFSSPSMNEPWVPMILSLFFYLFVYNLCI